MKILFSSHVFAPSVGGIETVSSLLAREFASSGHEVRLITETPGESGEAGGFEVRRRPTARELLALVRWCDVYFHNNISLPKAWPLLAVRRPWVVAHHVWIPESGLAARVKRHVLRYATGISISHAVAGHLATGSSVIPNPYDDSLFRTCESAGRTRDIAFVGRLVSDKGADLLVAAVAALSRRGLRPTVTIIGTGPEEASLKEQALASGVTVDFAGVRRGADLVALLNQHRLLVVPSRWAEPFGVVALEGIAAGCVVVGADSGGLPDAIGPCGVTFRSGDSEALADAIERLLRDPAAIAAFREPAERHMRNHRCERVAARYLKVFEHAIETFAAPGGARGTTPI